MLKHLTLIVPPINRPAPIQQTVVERVATAAVRAMVVLLKKIADWLHGGGRARDG
jgi:hypothetical protein